MKPSIPKKTVSVSLRISPELDRRYEQASKRTRLPRATLAIMALEAAVEAIERQGGIFVPITFDVKNPPMESASQLG